ncbi:MAG: hypothetical protein ACKOJF_20610 [Planctomycetaceae bacterium]
MPADQMRERCGGWCRDLAVLPRAWWRAGVWALGGEAWGGPGSLRVQPLAW